MSIKTWHYETFAWGLINVETSSNIYEVWQKSNETSNSCFFDRRGIIHTEFVPPGQTVNQVFIKMPLKGSEKGSFTWGQTLQTNGCSNMTTPHVTLPSLSHNFWPQKAFLLFPSPCYSPDLSPFDFFIDLKVSSKDVISGL